MDKISNRFSSGFGHTMAAPTVTWDRWSVALVAVGIGVCFFAMRFFLQKAPDTNKVPQPPAKDPLAEKVTSLEGDSKKLSTRVDDLEKLKVASDRLSKLEDTIAKFEKRITDLEQRKPEPATLTNDNAPTTNASSNSPINNQNTSNTSAGFQTLVGLADQMLKNTSPKSQPESNNSVPSVPQNEEPQKTSSPSSIENQDRTPSESPFETPPSTTPSTPRQSQNEE